MLRRIFVRLHILMQIIHRLMVNERFFEAAAFMRQVGPEGIFWDPLTGLNQRFYAEHLLEREITAAIRERKPFVIVILDVNNLKQINDNYKNGGHQKGDQAIAAVGRAIKSSCRGLDIAARWGKGDEFLLFLPGMNRKCASKVVGRIKEALLKSSFEMGFPISVSAGYAPWNPEKTWKDTERSSPTGRVVDHLIEFADQEMYHQKRQLASRQQEGGLVKVGSR